MDSEARLFHQPTNYFLAQRINTVKALVLTGRLVEMNLEIVSEINGSVKVCMSLLLMFLLCLFYKNLCIVQCIVGFKTIITH